jgi:hypothetical protein
MYDWADSDYSRWDRINKERTEKTGKIIYC